MNRPNHRNKSIMNKYRLFHHRQKNKKAAPKATYCSIVRSFGYGESLGIVATYLTWLSDESITVALPVEHLTPFRRW